MVSSGRNSFNSVLSDFWLLTSFYTWFWTNIFVILLPWMLRPHVDGIRCLWIEKTAGTGDTANCFVRAEIQSNERHHPVPHRSFVRMRFCHIDSTSWKLVRCPKLHNAISDITASGNYVCTTAIAKLNLHWTSKRQKHIFLSTRIRYLETNKYTFALPRFQRHMSWQPICEASSHLANIGLIPCDLGHPHGLKVPIATLFPNKTRRITRSSNQKKSV